MAELGLAKIVGVVCLTWAIAACSSGDKEKKQAECDAIADDIRRSAAARGIQGPGACNHPSFPEGKDACDRLATCNRELSEM
jgi:hypothetical protein